MENYTRSQPATLESEKTKYMAVVDVICYTMIAIIALFNLGAIIIILCTTKLQKAPKYITIINLSMVMLVLGLFVLMGQHANFVHLNASLYYYTGLFHFLCMACIISLCVVLNVDYIMRIVKPTIYEGNKKFALLVALLFAVYCINALLIVPLYTDTYVLVRQFGSTLIQTINPQYESIIVILSVIPQTAFVLITGVLAIVVYLGYRKSQLDTPTPLELLVTDTVVILLANIPLVLKYLLPLNFGFLPLALTVWLLPFLLPTILPLNWLLDKDYRHSFRDLVLCRCRKTRDTDSYEMM